MATALFLNYVNFAVNVPYVFFFQLSKSMENILEDLFPSLTWKQDIPSKV